MATSSFVGRANEIQVLADGLAKVMQGKPTLIFLAGEAGVGKSRIVKEFIDQVKSKYPKTIVAVGECNCHYGHADPLLPFRAISAQIFDEHPNKPKRSQSHSVTRKAAEVIAEIAPDTVGVFIPLAGLGLKLLHMLGKTALARPASRTDDTLFGRVAIFEQFSHLLFWAAEQAPLLLVLEDLHWSDAATLDFLFYLVRSWKTQKVMIIGTYRPSDVASEKNHPLQKILNELVRYDLCCQIEVGWLSESNVREWLNAIYHPNELPEEFAKHLYRRTEGNALFVDETLKFLQEIGTLYKDFDGVWTLSTQIRDITALPGTIVAVLEQRLARLESKMRDVLTCASVEGEEFTAQVVASIRHLEEGDVLEALEDVFDRKLRLVALKMERQLANRKWLTIFEFRHTLMQNYLYGTLSAPRRRRLHQLVGDYLEELYKDNLELIVTTLARHYVESGDLHKLIRYGLVSASHAERAYDFKAARVWLEKVAEHVPIVGPDPLIAADILCRLGRVQLRTGDFNQAESSYSRAFEYAAEVQDEFTVFRVLTDLAYLYTLTDRSDKAAEILEEIVKTGNEATSNVDFAYAVLHLAIAYQKAARHDLHFEYLMRARQTFSNLANTAGLADVDRALGIYYKIMGDFDQSVEHLASSIATHRDLGDKYGEALDYTNLGSTYFVVGNDPAKALMCYQRSLDLCREVSAVHEEAHVLLNMGRVCGLERRWSEAVAHVERGLELSNKVGRAYDSIRGSWYLGIVYHFQGLSDRAIEVYNHVMDLGVHDPWLLWPILCNWGSVEIIAGKIDRGLELYEKACSLLLEILAEMPKSEHRQFLQIQNRINLFRLLQFDASRFGNDQLTSNVREHIPADLLEVVTETLPRFYWGGGIWV